MFGVVVVLDDQSALLGPAHQLTAPFTAEDHAGRELVGWGEQDARGADGPQFVDAYAVGVDRDRRGGQLPDAQLLAGPEGPGVLHGDLADPGTVQHPCEQAERLGGAGDDDHFVRIRPDSPVAGQPVGDGAAQLRGPPGVSVAEHGRREVREYGALGAQPSRSRESGQIGHARRQVDPGRRRPQRVEDIRPGAGGERPCGERQGSGPGRQHRSGDDHRAGTAPEPRTDERAEFLMC